MSSNESASLNLPPVALLGGGLATRLRPMSETIPKALVDVAGKPMALRQVELLRSKGIRQVVWCVGYLGEMIQALLGDGSAYGISIAYSFDGDRLLGTGGALKKALPLLGPEFFVLYADAYLDCDYRALFGAYRAANMPGLMTIFRNENRLDRSNVIFENGRILRYDKRNHVPKMCYIDYGLSVLRADVFKDIPDGEPWDLADIYSQMAQRGEITGYQVYHRFYEVGSLESLEEARRHFEKQNRDES